MIKDKKQEFIKRYQFIYENADSFLPYYIKITGNTVKYNVPEYVLKEMESFLLCDTPCENTSFYERVNLSKDNNLYINVVNSINNEIEKMNCKYHLSNVKQVFQEVRNYILGQMDNEENKQKKLLALDEYFRFRRYNNSPRIQKDGALPSEENYGAFYYRFTNEDEPYERHTEHLKESDFVNFIADKNNHHEDNNSIFTEEEKQKVYLKNHQDVLPWNIGFTCNNTANDGIPCNSTFNPFEGNIFTSDGEEFYYMCPNCGNIIKLDDKKIPQLVKNKVIARALEDPTEFEAWHHYSSLYTRDKKSEGKKRIFVLNGFHI